MVPTSRKGPPAGRQLHCRSMPGPFRDLISVWDGFLAFDSLIFLCLHTLIIVGPIHFRHLSCHSWSVAPHRLPVFRPYKFQTRRPGRRIPKRHQPLGGLHTIFLQKHTIVDLQTLCAYGRISIQILLLRLSIEIGRRGAVRAALPEAGRSVPPRARFRVGHPGKNE